MKNLILENLIKETKVFNNAQFKQWKRKNVTLRGIADNADNFGVEGNNNGAMLGKGLYIAYLSNKALAKQYGKVAYLVNAKPLNPKKFQYLNDFEVFTQKFPKGSELEVEFQKLGYDGVDIVGREIVNYKPNEENIIYFYSDRQLENHFFNYVQV